jgi:hypothetical protein
MTEAGAASVSILNYSIEIADMWGHQEQRAVPGRFYGSIKS